MIKATGLIKRFEQFTALDCLNTTIENGCICGLVGSNGAGKSTLLRLIAGVYQPTEGSITIDDEPIYENESIKQQIYFVPDDLYFFPGSTMDDMAKYLKKLYVNWNQQRYEDLLTKFPMSRKNKLHNSSKGMRRQAALILALSCQPKYLLLDEAFDGLDPVLRLALRKIMADDVAQRGMTVIIASHNLRELEDVCDQVGLLHQGHILFQRELDDLKLGFCKVQAAFKPMLPEAEFKQALDILKLEVSGSMASIVARGTVEEVSEKLEQFHPLFCEAVPMMLEEIFIYEMEAVGYDYNNVLF